MVVIVGYLDLQLPVQSFSITTKVVSSNSVHVDTTLCDHATGRWFSPGIPVSSTNKTDCYDLTEILLKVALNTINLNQNHYFNYNVNCYFRSK